MPEHFQQILAVANVEQKMNACQLGDEPPRLDTSVHRADANEPSQPDHIGSNDAGGGLELESSPFPVHVDSATAEMMETADHLIS